MAGIQFHARRLIIAGGFAVAVAAPMVAVVAAAPTGVPAQLADCPGGEEVDTFTSACVPYLVPNSPFRDASSPASAAGTVPGGGTFCPPGVGGEECASSTGNEAQPQIPGPVQGQSPEQELTDVSTPDF